MNKRFFGWLLFIAMAICAVLLSSRRAKTGQMEFGLELISLGVCAVLSAKGLRLGLGWGRSNPLPLIRLIRKHPTFLAAFAVMGICVGAVFISFDEAWIVAIGFILLIFYTAVLLLLAIKLWNRTWVPFCDRAISILDG